MEKKYLAAKTVLVFALSGSIAPPFTLAGIPVIDSVNVSQNIIQAVQMVASTAKQIQEYQTQLQQYQNMLQNTMQPAQNIWDDAQSTMNSLRSAVDTLGYYETQLGSIDNYIQKFSDLAQYRNSPCFSSNGCSAAQWAAMMDSERLGSESQKKSSDALFKVQTTYFEIFITRLAKLSNYDNIHNIAMNGGGHGPNHQSLFPGRWGASTRIGWSR